MNITFYKYQGTGNDFIVIDNRNQSFPKNSTAIIQKLCHRRFGIGADGLMLLENDKEYDFRMRYFNSDGNEGSMCGNGGRCIVAFANRLGVIGNTTTFNAVDGIHHAKISGQIVSLGMNDVLGIQTFSDHVFLDTGSPHHVTFTKNIDELDVYNEGRKIRYGKPYFESGTNVNFVEKVNDNTFKVRTYERGVENETLSCGTGVTAVALSGSFLQLSSADEIHLQTRGGELKVSFKKENDGFTEIFLTGPATFVFKGEINI